MWNSAVLLCNDCTVLFTVFSPVRQQNLDGNVGWWHLAPSAESQSKGSVALRARGLHLFRWGLRKPLAVHLEWVKFKAVRTPSLASRTAYAPGCCVGAEKKNVLSSEELFSSGPGINSLSESKTWWKLKSFPKKKRTMRTKEEDSNATRWRKHRLPILLLGSCGRASCLHPSRTS